VKPVGVSSALGVKQSERDLGEILAERPGHSKGQLLLEAAAWRALRLPMKFPKQQPPNSPRTDRATGQETVQRTSAATPADVSRQPRHLRRAELIGERM